MRYFEEREGSFIESRHRGEGERRARVNFVRITKIFGKFGVSAELKLKKDFSVLIFDIGLKI